MAQTRAGHLVLGAVLAAVLQAGAFPAAPASAQEVPAKVPSEVRDLSRGLDVPYAGTPAPVVKAMLELAAPRPGELLVDLGSGDGRIVISAAKRFGVQGVGVDLNRKLVAIARERAAAADVADRAQFRVRDLFEMDLAGADIVTAYLLPDIMLDLRPRLFDTLAPGTRIVSHDYHMGSWWPDRTRVVEVEAGRRERVVYFWIVPARIAGEWEWRLDNVPGHHGSVDYTAVIHQRFQEIQGTVRRGYQESPFSGVRLKGHAVEFTIHAEVGGQAIRHRFSGEVDGEAIRGEVLLSGSVPETRRPWTARRVRGIPE